MEKITLTPIGTVEAEILSQLKHNIERTFNTTVEIAPQMAEPDYAYDPGRKQHLAPAILAALGKFQGRMLEICDVDLYAPGLNFIFGQADLQEEKAVISLCRLRQEYYGLPQDKELFQQRAIKEAVHELGHTYGLGHCPDELCVMHFSNSLADTDVKLASLCQQCGRELWKRL